MCVIVIKPGHAKMEKRSVAECWKKNPDGAGIMFSFNNELVVIKGIMSLDKFMAYFNTLSVMNIDVVMHFRIATHGSVSAQNTHPHYISKTLAVAHNGVIPGVSSINNLTDTEIFCRSVLSRLDKNFIMNRTAMMMIEEMIGQSKMVFMNNKGDVSVINKHLGLTVDGIWYSNRLMFSSPAVTRSYTPGYQSNFSRNGTIIGL